MWVCGNTIPMKIHLGQRCCCNLKRSTHQQQQQPMKIRTTTSITKHQAEATISCRSTNPHCQHTNTAALTAPPSSAALCSKSLALLSCCPSPRPSKYLIPASSHALISPTCALSQSNEFTWHKTTWYTTQASIYT